MPAPLIVHSISKRYVAGMGSCTASILALNHASLVARSGEIVGLVGPSGCGKSTLLLCASGLLRPDSGEVWWFERYRSISLCAALVRFVVDGPEAHRAIELAADHEARLILFDMRGRDVGLDARERLLPAFRRVVDRGGAVVVATRDQEGARSICSRVVELSTGWARLADEDALSRPPARVAEETRPTSVDPPFGWV